jgi:hypothetical protein
MGMDTRHVDHCNKNNFEPLTDLTLAERITWMKALKQQQQPKTNTYNQHIPIDMQRAPSKGRHALLIAYRSHITHQISKVCYPFYYALQDPWLRKYTVDPYMAFHPR